jgi:Ca-activated chloride channel homolog
VFTFLGYSFAGLAPAIAMAVAAAGSAALVALYLLREHQRRVRVAFVPLWEAHAGQKRVERLGRRLRRWISLLMQLTLLWLLVVALLDPRPAATAPAARTWLLLIDRSASMAARFGEADRLAAARVAAHRLVAALAPEDRAMVASFSREVTAETAFGMERAALDAAIDSVEPVEAPGDLARALAFGAAVLRGRPRPTLVVVGDGGYDGQTVRPNDLAGVDLHWVRAGSPGGNVALVSLSARRRPLEPGTVEVAFVVQSFATAPVSGAVEVLAGTGADRRVVERVAMTLRPGERVARTVAQVATQRGEIEARLVGVTPEQNLLAADDRAYALVPERARRRVLVVGADDLYLDGALLSFGDSLAVRRVAPAAAEGTRAEWARYDAVIFDGVAPFPTPTTGRFIYFDPHGAGSPWPEKGVLRDPAPTDANRHHPVLAQLALADLNIREARRLSLSPGDEALAASFGMPLVVVRSRPGLKALGLAFDVRRSDLPLRPTFPLLLANTFEWLDSRVADAPGAYRTGSVAQLPAATGATVATIVGPRGETFQRSATAGTIDVPLSRSGFYDVATAPAGERRTLAANLFDPSESDTRLGDKLVLGGRTIAPWQPPAPSRRRPWAVVALLAAFGLSLVEWASHHRRWTV